MICKNCGSEISDSDAYCHNCGKAVSSPFQEFEQTVIEEDPFAQGQNEKGSAQHKTYCYNCGKPLDPSQPYCMNCGVRTGHRESKTKKVGFVEAYELYWKNYFKFNGRATLAEYWFVVLWNLIFNFVTSFLQLISGVSAWSDAITDYLEYGAEIPPLSPFAIVVMVVVALWGLANFIPDLALTIRRLHDTGKSGWWIFISLIPLAGIIILIVLLASPSQPERNQYDE